MAGRIRIGKQLELSAVPGSVLVTDVTNEPSYVAPGAIGQVLTVTGPGVLGWDANNGSAVSGNTSLSAYSAGVLSGFSANSVSGWTIDVGGNSGVQDAAIFKNPDGESQVYTGVAGVSLSFVIGGAPGTVGHSRTDALVIYKDEFGTAARQVVAGTSATTGTQVPPNNAAIRSAIPTGTLKFVVVVGYVTTAYGATGTATGAYSRGMAGNMSTPAVVANITERNYLPLVAGMKCYQTNNAMEQICDGTTWNNVPRLLKKATLTTAGDTISVTGIPLRDNLTIRASMRAGGVIQPVLRFNDTSSGYAYIYSVGFGAGVGVTSWNNLLFGATVGGEAMYQTSIAEVVNTPDAFKTVEMRSLDTYGGDATTTVNHIRSLGKWCSTNQVTKVSIINAGPGDFAAGSYAEVWG